MAWHAEGLQAMLDIFSGCWTETPSIVLGELRTEEKTSVMRLVTAYRGLSASNRRTSSPYRAAVLRALAVAAETLRVEMVPRDYRKTFTQNYRLLLPDQGRHYRVDVLKASMERRKTIWVNGEVFEFSAETISRATALQEAWTTLTSMLDWCDHSPVWPSSSAIRSTMAALDVAWAAFEHRYISELIVIEEKSRHLIVEAIEHEKKLQQLEGLHEDENDEALYSLPEYREEQQCLAWFVSRLNSVANRNGKGRGDLGAGVLFAALETHRQSVAAEKIGESTEATAAAKVLAASVIESFNAMRSYLRNVADSVDKIDPCLRENAALVERLVDWERNWEVGSQYIQNPRLLDNLCDIVACIQRAQRSVPALAAMFQNLDPEVFMIFPRLILLRFLIAPGQHSELMKSLQLPALMGDDEFIAFKEIFQSTRRVLTAAVQRPKGMSAEGALWDLLLKRAASGTAGSAEPRDLLPQHREPVLKALEELLRALEPWSIRLQRHCPEDWNQFLAVVVGCLTRAQERLPARCCPA